MVCRFFPLLLSIFLAATARADMHRILALDFTLGTPGIVDAGGHVQAWKSVQLGFGYGLMTGLPLMSMTLEKQQIDLDSGISVDLQPKLTFRLSTLTPFVRYFPHPNNFYVQLSLPLWIITTNVTGTLSHPLLGELEDSLTGTITLTQPLPTLSVGYFFGDNLYFFNLSIGATFYMDPLVAAAFKTAFPDGIGSNDAAIDQMTSQMQTQVSSMMTQIRDFLPFIPSLNLSFGLFL